MFQANSLSPNHRTRKSRKGMTLLEVLISLAIFFMSIVAITSLVDMARDRAEEAEQRSVSLLVAESKIAEIKAGVTGLTSGSGIWDTDDRYTWSVDVQSVGTSLYQVTATAQRDGASRSRVDLIQYVVDPQAMGSTMDAIPEELADGSTGTTGSTTTGGTTSGSTTK